jgi:hypothetical protein
VLVVALPAMMTVLPQDVCRAVPAGFWLILHDRLTIVLFRRLKVRNLKRSRHVAMVPVL